MVKKNIEVSYTQNRELSWLNFNKRVLEEADAKEVKLLEKLKFMEIFESNLNEFFMVRVGSLYDLTLNEAEIIDNKTGMNQWEQIDAILDRIPEMYDLKDEYYNNVEAQLRDNGIYNLYPEELDEGEYKEIESYFDNYIRPVLSPQIIDIYHPFPYLANKESYIIMRLRRKYDKDSPKKLRKYEHAYSNKDFIGILSIPNILPKFIKLSGDKERHIMIEKIVKEFAGKAFNQYDIKAKHVIRVTRNMDLKVDELDYDHFDSWDVDFKDVMSDLIKKRARLQAVRLEVECRNCDDADKKLIKYIMDELNLDEKNVIYSKSPLSMSYVYDYIGNLPKELSGTLTYEPYTPQNSIFVDSRRPMIEQIREKDVFLSFPYESINPLIDMLREAAHDPKVVSIKITIYRLANNSQIVSQLVAAAENGKEVTVLMELKARFDEKNNIIWANRLEEAGCNIIYGFDRFKVHSKICLITRFDENKFEYITQVSTGNYNEKTAKLYTDFCLMTGDESIGRDAVRYFNNMMIGELEEDYNELMVSPYSLGIKLEQLIDEEIKKGEDGYIRLKMNSISDKIIMSKLSEASQKGVKIDMIVRGICCLVPGVKGKTDNIRIMNVVGRFLEHHRVYCFGKGADMKVYISSADFMTRNLRKRVEVACPIKDKDIKNEINHILDLMFSDNVKGRQIDSTGNYIPNAGNTQRRVDSQYKLMKEAMLKADPLYERVFSEEYSEEEESGEREADSKTAEELLSDIVELSELTDESSVTEEQKVEDTETEDSEIEDSDDLSSEKNQSLYEEQNYKSGEDDTEDDTDEVVEESRIARDKGGIMKVFKKVIRNKPTTMV